MREKKRRKKKQGGNRGMVGKKWKAIKDYFVVKILRSFLNWAREGFQDKTIFLCVSKYKVSI